MKEPLERELKLAVDDGFELPPLPIAITPRRLRAIYHDTADHRLARRGVTLRRRSEDGRDHWQLKLPVDGDRLELEWEADDSAIPAELAALVTAFVRGRPLQPVAELHTLRRSVKVTSGGRPAAEVVHDTVEVLQGSRVVRSFAEVEIEQLADGSTGLMQRLERQLRAVGARRGDGRPRLLQALDIPVPRQVAPKRSAPPIEHLRAYLLQQVESLLRNDPVDPVRRDARRPCDARRHAAHAQRPQGGAQAARPRLGAGDARGARVARRDARRGARPRRLRELCRGRGRAARSRRARKAAASSRG